MPKRLFAVSALLFLGLSQGSVLASGADEGMPAEYQTLKRIVDRLAASNDLGSRPLLFTVVTGWKAADLAQELGLCKDDACNYYSQLNPFRRYGGKTDEIIRQSYLHGYILPYAGSSGTLEFPRQIFRIFDNSDDLLMCSVAGAIATSADHHKFQMTRDQSADLQGKSDNEQALIKAQYSRYYAHLSDRKAYDMSLRAGYASGTCFDSIQFVHRMNGSGAATQDDSSYLGFDDRMSFLKEYAASEDSARQIKAKRSTLGTWEYSSNLNYLKFTPQ